MKVRIMYDYSEKDTDLYRTKSWGFAAAFSESHDPHYRAYFTAPATLIANCWETTSITLNTINSETSIHNRLKKVV